MCNFVSVAYVVLCVFKELFTLLYSDELEEENVPNVVSWD